MKLYTNSRIVFAALLALPFALRADEGMWTYEHFPKQLVQQRYGFTPTDAWLDHIRLSSVRFNNGGSGSFVSPEGLVMTNHHVGSDCIHDLGTADHDYMTTGFYAAARQQEAKCPNLELNVLMAMEDVTSAVNAGIPSGEEAAKRNAAQKKSTARIEKECTEHSKLRCDVITFYAGQIFGLYKYKKYTDVRLVFAPESAIAFYGGDPDNFNYPRYDLDICFFRVYENNQPVKTANYLTWNPAGIAEGDVVFVSGNPGSTNRQDTLAQLKFARDVMQPGVLQFLNVRLKLLREYSARGPEEERIAKATIFSYENSVKDFQGRQTGLLDPEFMARRAAVEKDLSDRVNADPKMRQEFGGAWDRIAAAEKTYAGLAQRQGLYSFSLGQSDLFRHARTLVRSAVELAKPNGDRLQEYRDSNLDSLKQDLFSEAPIHGALDKLMLAQAFREWLDVLGTDNAIVKQALNGRTPEVAAEAYVDGSKLASAAERKRLFEGGQKAIDASGDSMIALARIVDAESRELRKRFEDQVEAVELANGTLLAQARFAAHGTDVYPEATFNLRLSFGAVRGYVDGGRPRRWYTSFHGLYENSVGIPPYKLPQRWLDKKSALNLDTPFNFVCTADITGGNSGSPVVNRNGELVGIVFDSNIQGIPNDFLYTDTQARTVAVHAAGIVEALRAVYAADSVLRELQMAPKK
jgi:hypothetical protein